MKNRANIKMNDVRLKAIINLLSKEGILTHEEVEQEVNKLINQEEGENPSE